MANDLAEQAVIATAAAITADEVYQDIAWTGITLIVRVREEPLMLNGVTGYYYTAEQLYTYKGEPQRWQAAIPSVPTREMFLRLAHAPSNDCAGLWKYCLFQLDRESGAVTTDFSYEGHHPWRVQIPRLNAWVEEVRPSAD